MYFMFCCSTSCATATVFNIAHGHMHYTLSSPYVQHWTLHLATSRLSRAFTDSAAFTPPTLDGNPRGIVSTREHIVAPHQSMVTFQFLPPADVVTSMSLSQDQANHPRSHDPSSQQQQQQQQQMEQAENFNGGRASHMDSREQFDHSQHQLYLQQQQGFQAQLQQQYAQQAQMQQQQLNWQHQQQHRQDVDRSDAPNAMTLDLMKSWQPRMMGSGFSASNAQFAVPPVPDHVRFLPPPNQAPASPPTAHKHAGGRSDGPPSSGVGNRVASTLQAPTSPGALKEAVWSASDDDDDLDDDSMSARGGEGGMRKRKGALGRGKIDATGAPQAMSHLMTERKRREKLNAQFLALRGVVPNITKMNKLSTLEDAINYIKRLQGQVLSLEMRLKSAVEHGSSENPQGSLSNVSSPKDFKDIPAPAPPQIHRPDAEPEAAAVAPGPEQAAVEVVAKEAEGGQVVAQLQAGRRKGLVADMMTAMDDLSLDVHQVSVMTSGACTFVTLLTSASKTFREGGARGFEDEIRDQISKVQSGASR